ncbi:hypothetical protein AGABI2DRAFT_194693 [Agaricus bisporus var. bisporus H97]|uniref:hypothetical protein n=1 Tax=Agaricus bisporus var. bisporus (strain H97 / ATCC MYA-4626 / FGSC 10389) TaxID=936046 RepID=UPI00029F7372|nr:hypothetical protein AGABI2DRAFT_194693 [Agaricus bisporus var. bisporus H97]EKV44797.1 hypothetical protein AGABI2DRAFT_194693 [Agaricus bisporus var. bisporus H97]
MCLVSSYSSNGLDDGWVSFGTLPSFSSTVFQCPNPRWISLVSSVLDVHVHVHKNHPKACTLVFKTHMNRRTYQSMAT